MKSGGSAEPRPAPPELYGRSGFAPPRAGRQTRTFTPIKRKKTVQPKGHTAQNNSMPASFFNNHQLIKYGNKYYDRVEIYSQENLLLSGGTFNAKDITGVKTVGYNNDTATGKTIRYF